MGDIDIFQPGELESIFWKYHGPKDESIFQLLGRSFKRLNDMIVRPARHEYSDSDIPISSQDIKTRIFFVNSSGVQLKCAFWERATVPSSRCILYLHTNTRSIVDAKELMPLCDILQCSLFSFDLPGCGQSEGSLSFFMAIDVCNIVEWLANNAGIKEVILWARGMSSAPAIEFCSKGSQHHLLVKHIILDSPFTSIRAMIEDAAAAIRAKGYFIPKFVLSFCESRARAQIKVYLGGDIYGVNSLKYAPVCTTNCTILSALGDDYIPATHGRQLAAAWGGRVTYRTFAGRHFGTRSPDLVLSLADILGPIPDSSTHIANCPSDYFLRDADGVSDVEVEVAGAEGPSRPTSSLPSSMSESDISKLLLPSRAKEFIEKSKSTVSLFSRNGFC